VFDPLFSNAETDLHTNVVRALMQSRKAGLRSVRVSHTACLGRINVRNGAVCVAQSNVCHLP